MPEKGFDSFSNTGESDGRAGDRGRGATVFEAATSKEEREKLFAEIEELERKIAEEKALQREIEEKLNRIRASKGTTEGGEGAGGESGGTSGDVLSDAMNEMRDIAQGESGVTAEEIVEEVEEEEGGNEDAPDDVEAEPDKTEVKKTSDRAKRDRRIGAFLTGVVALGLAGGIIWFGASRRDKSEETPEPLSTVEAEVAPSLVTEEDFGIEEGEVEKGIYDGYGEAGMWLSEGKTSAVAFAEAGRVAEVCNNDEVEMIKYTAHNQVESFADYMANLPEALQPDGFKGLNLLQTEAKLESLSPEEYAAIEATFGDIMDNAFTRRVTLNGQYDNAFMRMKDPNGAAVHENMELVRCTTTESNVEVTEFYWMDTEGREVGKMTVKMAPVYDEDGNIVSFELCEQVVNEPGDDIYDGVPEIPEDPEKPDEPSGPEETPPPDETTPPEETIPPEETVPPEETTPPEETIPPDETTPPEETVPPEETTPPEVTPPPVLPTPLITPTPAPVTPTPTPTLAPKDADNMTRIDDDIESRIEYDYDTNEVVIPQATAAPEDITEQPAAEAYQGTEAAIVENEAAPAAEPVQDYVSYANDYSQNLGGTNATEYAPVQENQAAQTAADAAEIPVSQAPTSGQGLADALGDLGIN